MAFVCYNVSQEYQSYHKTAETRQFDVEKHDIIEKTSNFRYRNDTYKLSTVTFHRF